MADYNAVHKDKCLTEFMRLKDCYLVRIMPHTLCFKLGGGSGSSANSGLGCGEEAVMVGGLYSYGSFGTAFTGLTL